MSTTPSRIAVALGLAALLAACLPGPTPTPAPEFSPAATQVEPPGAGRCGDTVCTGPENARNCPQDCAPTTTPTSASATQAATSAPTAPPASKSTVIRIGGVNGDDQTVKPLLGVISGPDPGPESTAPNLTPQLQDIGVTSIRNNDYYDDRLDMEGIFNCGGSTYPSWEGCDPNDERFYTWEASDAQFSSYLAGGFEPFLRLGGEWQNAAPQHDFKGPQNKAQEQNWIVASRRVVARYLNWQGRNPAFSYLDIWTEFPSEHFWDRDPRAFFRFWAAAYTELKAAYPLLRIGGPGFVAGQTLSVIKGDKNSIPAAFLEYLYQNKVKPDWIGWHLFQNDPLQWWRASQAYQDLLSGTGQYASVAWAGTGFFADTEVIVDAYGTSAVDERGVELSLTERDKIYNRQEAASILTAAWIAMQYQDIERAYYYRAGDPKSSPGASASSRDLGGPGLFYGDAAGTYKPAAHAVRLWSRIVEDFPALLTTELPPTTAGVELWVLAAQNDKGQMAVLISNVTDENIAWTMELTASSLQYRQGEIYQVDDTQDGSAATAWSGGPVTIPAGSVQLIILMP